MATMATIDVPNGLSPKEEKKWIAREKRQLKMKARAKEMAEDAMGAAIACGTAYAYGVLEDKLPNGGKIPGTNLGFDLAGGLLLTGAGVFTAGKMSSAMMYAGLGMLLPVLRDYGRAATFF